MSLISDSKLIFLYQKVEEQKTSGLEITEFCDKEKINLNDFRNFKYCYNYIDRNSNVDIEKYNQVIAEMKNTNITIREISKKYGLSFSSINTYSRCLRIKSVINKFKEEKEQTMNFVKVETRQPIKEPRVNPEILSKIENKEHEFIEKQNDLELIVSKGIKVIVSPQIESMKLIKIIEFLRNI